MIRMRSEHENVEEKYWHFFSTRTSSAAMKLAKIFYAKRNPHGEWHTHTRVRAHTHFSRLAFCATVDNGNPNQMKIAFSYAISCVLVSVLATRNIDRGVGCIINQWQSANVNAIRFGRVAQILKNTSIRACLWELLNVSSRRASGDDRLTHGKVEGGQQSRG